MTGARGKSMRVGGVGLVKSGGVCYIERTLEKQPTSEVYEVLRRGLSDLKFVWSQRMFKADAEEETGRFRVPE